MYTLLNMNEAHPFLKWVGGKTQLIPTLIQHFPKQIDTYFEPFLGGGAVFWHLASQKKFKNAVLNDVNRELIDCYRVLRDFPDEFIIRLTEVETEYEKAENPKEVYTTFKDLVPGKLNPVERAVRTVLLNKSGFNGLYRTNSHGGFNVPWGKRLKVKLFDEKNLRACSEILNRQVSLLSVDFTEAIELKNEFDVVYIDPPYVPASRTANFVSYTDGKFTHDDHYRLATFFKTLVKKGGKVILSNSDVPEVRAMYDGFELYEIKAKRAINCDGTKRGPVGELIIVGRPVKQSAWEVFAKTP